MQTKAGIAVVFKGLMISAGITFAAVLILALLILKTGISEKTLRIAVIAVYAVACFASGFYNGRKLKQRRFIWGIAGGILYFLILLVLSLATGQGQWHAGILTAALICLGSGMFGGMIG